MSSRTSYDVVIVGLGAMGSAAAYHLARRGLTVAGFDRWSPPHGNGSSGGGTRVFRAAYFEGPTYVPLALRAKTLWQELEAASGARLLRTTGAVSIGGASGELVPGAVASGRQYNLELESWSLSDLRARVPQLEPAGHELVLWEPGAGVLDPEGCIRAHLDGARAAGAHVSNGCEVAGWSAGASDVAITTATGEVSGRQLVLTSGAWLPELLSFDLHLEVERQVQLWFRPAAPMADLPVVLWELAPGEAFYLVPDHATGRVKAALHHGGEVGRGPEVRRAVEAADIAAVRQLLARYVPTIDGEPEATVVCRYTNTTDRHFVIDTHPLEPRVLVVSPCSGHGFKFASAIGEAVADMVVGQRPAVELDAFRIDRFS